MVMPVCALGTFMVFALALGIAEGAPPTAMFIFGDSLVDVGNNNHLLSSARANFRPNGIDYPGQIPTGRFSNGFLISDYLSQHWGMEATLAVNDPNAKGQNVLRGVNFASAGAGILDDSGWFFLQRIRMSQQITRFQEYVGNLTELVGESAATQIVSGGLVSITIGANDFLSNYFFVPVTPRKIEFTQPQYLSLLISRLSDQIKAIYGSGARNIVIAGLGPMGCIPLLTSERFLTDKGNCIPKFQQVAISFNAQLKSLAEELQQELPDATFLYSNGFDVVYSMIQNPAAFGFENAKTACCGQGSLYKGLIPCNPTATLCSNRSAYMFWDPFHPTAAVNALVAQRVLFGPPTDISPINLSQLFP